MSMTVSQGDGLTVITVASNPKSKWPLLCQILGYLCYSPVCSVSVSKDLKGKLKDVQTAFGVVQMIIGVLNIVVGIVFSATGLYFNMYLMAQSPFWIGSLFILFGILCVLTAKSTNSCLMVIGMIVNIVSIALATTAIVLYALDISLYHYDYNDCESSYNSYSRYDDYRYGGERYRTPSPEENRRKELCLYYKNGYEIAYRGLDGLMIVFSVLQLCMSISFCVLTGKVLSKKTNEDEKLLEDPELHKPDLEPACV